MFLCFISCGMFFFFKQKTAYDMRISDWSSDVCASDLTLVACRSVVAGWKDRAGDRRQSWPRPRNSDRIGRSWRNRDRGLPRHHADGRSDRRYPPQHSERRHHGNARSEEHTSELQSLMRSSYAVFCLKKKTQSNQQNPKHEIL